MSNKNRKKAADLPSEQLSIKRRIFEIIQIGNRSDVPSTMFDIFIVAVILINIAVTFSLTFDKISPLRGLLQSIEFVTIVIFLVEYVLRVWTAGELFPDKGRLQATLRYLISFYGIIDLLTILPYFLPFLFPSGAVAFRMFRVVRILHLFRINANYDAFNVITDVLRDKKDQLISSVFLILVLLLGSSLCMYDLEHAAQPENFENAFSGIWWAVSTLLTVGYGDIYPVTVGGRIMAIVIAFLGVGVVAIPTGIISAGFVEYYTKIKSGAYAQKEADFVTIEVGVEHPFVGQAIKDLAIPQGLYVAVLMRGEDVNTPYPDLLVESGDYLLLGTMGNMKIEGSLDEVIIDKNHPWLNLRIKDLDISRQSFVVMIKRKSKNIRPQADFVLKEDDTVLILEKKRAIKHKRERNRY